MYSMYSAVPNRLQLEMESREPDLPKMPVETVDLHEGFLPVLR
jgi:hypothetical protein